MKVYVELIEVDKKCYL